MKRYSLDGREVTVIDGPGLLTVALDGRELRVEPEAGRAFAFVVEDRKLRFIRHSGLLSYRADLVIDDHVLHPVDAMVPLVPAPPGALCAKHFRTEAEVSCGRCGTFACAHCRSLDRARCLTCSPLDRYGAPRGISPDWTAGLLLVGGPLVFSTMLQAPLAGIAAAAPTALSLYASRRWLSGFRIPLVAMLSFGLTLTCLYVAFSAR